MIPFVSGSLRNTSKQSMKSVPLNGSPPMPTHKVCPNPTSVVWWTASYVKVPERETTPMTPFLWMWPGMMPILHWKENENVHRHWHHRRQLTASGAMIPGQFGPTNRDLFCASRRFFTFTMSCWGMPSVMATISGISASRASMMALAAPGGGT